MRQVSNILMAALVVTALFLGNCLSCPQVLVAIAGQHAGHSCCHHPSAKIDCHSQSLSHFVKAQGNPPPMLAISGVLPAVAVSSVVSRQVIAPLRAADAPPPDLLSLHSLLRV
jgi:hypothetical protein